MVEFLIFSCLATVVGVVVTWAVMQGQKPKGRSVRPARNHTAAEEHAAHALDALTSTSPRSAVPRPKPMSLSLPSLPIPRPAQRPFFSGLTWFGVGHQVRVMELSLVDPLTYFLDQRNGSQIVEPAAIDVSLPIARQGYAPTSRELPYWPKYSALTPAQRRNYLEWLAGGRHAPPAELGYTFLFIYGLERRALEEHTDQKVVFDEVMRLREMYGSIDQLRGSFDAYTCGFLWFLAVRDPQAISLRRVHRLAGSISFWAEDTLATALAWFCLTKTPLPDWAAFSMAGGLPQSQRSVVVGRVTGELRKLFCKRYAERFGAGIALEQAKRDRLYGYRPASAALPRMEVSAANPLGRPKQLQPLSDIWNQCVQELRKLSTVMGKSAGQSLTVAAWEAMPAEIRVGVDHPLTDALCRLIEQAASQEGHFLFEAAKIADALALTSGPRLTPAQSRRLCAVVGDIGYNLEPDARITGKAYKPAEKVAVFLRSSDDATDAASYNAAAYMLRLGMAVAASDGHVHETETSLLMERIRTALELGDEGQRRLEALRDLLAVQGQDLASLAKLANVLSPAQRQSMGTLVVALIAADGVITPDELRAMRRCYSILGFTGEETEQALRSLGTLAPDEPVTVQAAGPKVMGEAIPHPPVPGAFRLDHAAIAAIMQDTQEVARMLAEVMEVNVGGAAGEIDGIEREASAPAAPPALVVTPFAEFEAEPEPGVVIAPQDAVPARYAAFYEALIGRGEWGMKEADTLARRHGHMLAGAIEVLNEWAVERYGGQLFVEDADKLTLERGLLQ